MVTDRLPPILIHHTATLNEMHPPNSVSAIRSCLEAGAQVIEVDISPLADGNFLLFHDARLEDGTDGRGVVARATREQIQSLYYVDYGKPTAEPLAFLDQALALIGDYAGLLELQLDLKPYVVLGEQHLAFLLQHIEPVKQRVRLTSTADWELWRLYRRDPELQLGFDPYLYLDTSDATDDQRDGPPFRRGAYGYFDDHPLAWQHWGSTTDYLRLRAELLARQAPPGVYWYIRASTLASMLDDGFDWIDYLHRLDFRVVAWTLHATRPGDIELALRLIDHGVDRLTAEVAPLLAKALGPAVRL